MKSPEQFGGLERKDPRNQRFESLVKSLVAGSSTLPAKSLGPDTKLGIIEAIERNEVTLYVSDSAGDRVLDAVHCLTAIYDELGKDEPDEDFVEQTVEQLKEYL